MEEVKIEQAVNNKIKDMFEANKIMNYQLQESEEFSKNSIIWKEKYEEVKSFLKSYNLFSDELIDTNTDFYFNRLGFTSLHFAETSSQIISKIIVCIITAKINQSYSSDTYFPIFEEKQDNLIFIISKVFAQDNKTRLNYKMERKIEEKYFCFSDMTKECYRLKSFRSVHSLFDQGEVSYQEPLRTYILELPTYTNEPITENEKDLRKLMDVHFYNLIKDTESEQIYYDLNKAVLHDLTGQFIQVHHCETSDETFTLSIAVKRSNVISHFFSLVGDCLNMHKCFSSSKYVEPLKNGVLIMILNVVVGRKYSDRSKGGKEKEKEMKHGKENDSDNMTNNKINGSDENENKNENENNLTEYGINKKRKELRKTIHQIISSLKTLCLFHNPQFIRLTVKRIFTAQESAYIYIVMKFITFFSTNTYSSYKNVEKALNLKSNTNSSILSDFYIIKEKLKSSKFSETEIFNCVQSNVKTVKLLFKNFERKFSSKQKEKTRTQTQMQIQQHWKHSQDQNQDQNPQEYCNQLNKENKEMETLKDSKEIISEIEDNYHKKILHYFYIFEKYVVKTNFFLTHKISFAIAFDGALLKDSIYEAAPYSIIMVLGVTFVGFHIRFSKISRGGVRIVISNNINSYTHNYENLFDEAFNLSYTQNFKNKDIPEGGSKGIILLQGSVCNTPNTVYIKNLCFYSYVNSLLDLLTEDCAKENEEEKGYREKVNEEKQQKKEEEKMITDGTNSQISHINNNNNNNTHNNDHHMEIKNQISNNIKHNVKSNNTSSNTSNDTSNNGLHNIEEINTQTNPNLAEEKEEDLIFLGPDENTGCDNLMDWGALMAKKRNYKYWKTFTTGKLRKNGGVPHDYYGMTTLGIETYIKKLCQKINIKEENIYRSIVGGPDGDLGSNCILQSKTKIISIIDGSGVLYDKKGLNKEELVRLANIRKYGITTDEKSEEKKQEEKEEKEQKEQKIEKKIEQRQGQGNALKTCAMLYNEKYLSDEGFKISIEQSNVQIFGKFIKNGLDFRNTFFLNELNKCELFNPCGGRPHSINIFNVNNIIKNDKCIYKYIVEGANVFISDDAREILEKKNVILFKDASTNKGGVISSSLEVLAGLVLEDDQYLQLMCSDETDLKMEDERIVSLITCNQTNTSTNYNNNSNNSTSNSTNNSTNTDANTNRDIQNEDLEVSSFYKEYVKEIQEKIKYYCELEFEALWNETRRTKTPICEATNVLSQKISQLKRDIINSNTLCFDYKLVKRVLEDVIPPVLLKIVPFEQIYKKVPFSYMKSFFAAALASKYYYSQQFLSDVSVFKFFEFVKNLQEN